MINEHDNQTLIAFGEGIENINKILNCRTANITDNRNFGSILKYKKERNS